MSRKDLQRQSESLTVPGDFWRCSRRQFMIGTAWAFSASLIPGFFTELIRPSSAATNEDPLARISPIHVRDKVPDPKLITFKVHHGLRKPIDLAGHFWFNQEAIARGIRCPAIVDFNPYRRRDGEIYQDSEMYPWIASRDYLCFRVDLQGSGDSAGVITDEYTEEEIAYCIQVIRQIAAHPWCDGNVGMMGISWGGINSLLVASHADCPPELKAVIVACGNDDRYSDDIHYMGGAMMHDNHEWASYMWAWLSQPPDPAVVGRRWKRQWGQRIGKADFWFKHWVSHATRDSYWQRASVRDHYDRVKVPVYILSGWEDGYKNPVDQVFRGLSALGKPAVGMLGPWGHSYPFNGVPGPIINWLPYIVEHWWDKWLKGRRPAAETELPPLTVWLGQSREPGQSGEYGQQPDYVDLGRWVAEDADWPMRVQEHYFHLAPGHRLSSSELGEKGSETSSSATVVAKTMPETSSFASPTNADLPGNMEDSDVQSLYFDSEALESDLDCFGYPKVRLTLTCDQPVVMLAARLCEISPDTKASHLVSYTFHNLCYAGDNLAQPRRLQPGVPFRVEIPLNIMGHTFRAGWKIRLALSTSLFPTLWQGVRSASITVHTGLYEDWPSSVLVLPGRPARQEDVRMTHLLLPDDVVVCADAEDYVPMDQAREKRTTREVHSTFNGLQKTTVYRKYDDAGRYCYRGMLGDLWVDQVVWNEDRIINDEPLSRVVSARSETTMERPAEGWYVRTRTFTKVWTDLDRQGRARFRYKASIKADIKDASGRFKRFKTRVVRGSIPRRWI